MKVLIVIGLGLLMTGCAYVAPVEITDAPGFLYGLLHGFIMLFTAILAFFTDVQMYASPNSGALYDLGFMLGAMLFFGGGAKAR